MKTVQDTAWIILGENTKQYPPYPKADFSIKGLSKTSSLICGVITQGNPRAQCLRGSIGAELALSCTLAHLKKAAPKQPAVSQPADEFMADILSGIIADWKNAVAEHFAATPLSAAEQASNHSIDSATGQEALTSPPLEIYDTSMLLLIMFREIAYIACIGVGQVLIINEDGQLIHVTNQILPDETIYLANARIQDVTTVSAFNIENIRIEFILMASDGYGSSFKEQDGLIKAAYDFSRLLDIQGQEFVSRHLPVWLDKTIQNGSEKPSAIVMAKKLRRWYDGLSRAISRETNRIDDFIADTSKSIHDIKYSISQQKMILDNHASNDREIQITASSIDRLNEKIDVLQEKLNRQYRALLLTIPALLVLLLMLSIFIVFAVNYAKPA